MFDYNKQRDLIIQYRNLNSIMRIIVICDVQSMFCCITTLLNEVENLFAHQNPSDFMSKGF